MKIFELIAILEKHPNHDADINFVVNTTNPDVNEDDINCPNAIVLRQDDFYEDFIEILVSDKELK